MKYGVKFKSGVVCKHLQEDMVDAINWLAEFANQIGTHIVITSMNDSKHSDNSFHYKDKAIDIRIRNLTVPQQLSLVSHFNNDDRYDCVLESNHIHLEVDPK